MSNTHFTERLSDPDPKRRKLESKNEKESSGPRDDRPSTKGAIIRQDGTMTPLCSIDSRNEDIENMDVDSVTAYSQPVNDDCPCGYLHGPGDQHHDITAVGLASVPLLRGPE